MSGSGESSGPLFVNPVEKFEESFMKCLASLTKEDTLTNVDRDEIRADVEQGISNVIECARTVESYFLKKRQEISAQKPELQIKDDSNELRLEMMRKDELLKKNYEKISHWQNILSDVQAAGKQVGSGGPANNPQQPNIPPGSHPGGGAVGGGMSQSGPLSQGPMSVGPHTPMSISQGPHTPMSISQGPHTPMSISQGPHTPMSISQGPHTPMSISQGPHTPMSISQGPHTPMSISQGPHTPMSQGPMTPTGGGGRPNTPGSGRPQTPGGMGASRMQNANIGYSPSVHQQSIGSPQLGPGGGHGMGGGGGPGLQGPLAYLEKSASDSRGKGGRPKGSGQGKSQQIATCSTWGPFLSPTTPPGPGPSKNKSKTPKVSQPRKPRAKKSDNVNNLQPEKKQSRRPKSEGALKDKVAVETSSTPSDAVVNVTIVPDPPKPKRKRKAKGAVTDEEDTSIVKPKRSRKK
ncbi:basic salivary proline-rich protein 1 isoform X1 [Folsomia candida]|nr:basic salivary proline-rich protein 1 isoform X1 [Folsomia candida]